MNDRPPYDDRTRTRTEIAWDELDPEELSNWLDKVDPNRHRKNRP